MGANTLRHYLANNVPALYMPTISQADLGDYVKSN